MPLLFGTVVDGTLLFSGSRDNCVRLWDTTKNTSISEKEVSRNLVSFNAEFVDSLD